MRKLRWYHGIIITFLSIGVLIFLCAPLQYYLGYTGLVVSELLLAITAIIPVLITREKVSEVFPIGLPPAKDFFGAVFMYGGIFYAMSVVILLEQLFFPSTVNVSEPLGNTITGLSPWMSVIVIALIPAFCEELLNRGTILFCLTHLKSKTAAIIISGALFGIMHLDPVRFFPTAILGCFFAYLAVKTGSLFFPLLFHFLNNLISIVSAFSSIGADAVENVDTTIELSGVTFAVLGYYIGISALFLTVGIMIFNGLKKHSSLKIAAIVVSFLIITLSSFLIMFSSFTGENDYTADRNNNGSLPIQTAQIEKYDVEYSTEMCMKLKGFVL